MLLRWQLTRWLLVLLVSTSAITRRVAEYGGELEPDFAGAVRTAAAQKNEYARLEDADQTGMPELQGFADGLRADRAAVEAGLTLSWSQGQTEGQVNRLKTLKRAMYGRAKFELLKLRVLRAA